jgi:hypothetical protein
MDPDQLYGLPLDRFIAERSALVKALRADGQREQAAEVGALRKPSVAAWAVNQLVRTQRRAVDALFAAGDALRDVQAEVMAGRQDAQSLRDAAAEERAAVDVLIEAARGLLTSEGDGLSSTVVDRVADTLHAAALDDEARAEVDEGRLERELRHVGLGAGAFAAAASPAKPARHKATPSSRGSRATKATANAETKAKATANAETKAKATANAETKAKANANAEAKAKGNAETTTTTKANAKKKTKTEGKTGTDGRASKPRAADLRRAERERADVRRAARSAEADARREADRAARALRIAQERRERAVQALAEADEELAEATSTAQDAVQAHGRARNELDAL